MSAKPAEQQAAPDLAVIRARRVDSDDVTESVVEVVVPGTPIGQRVHLSNLVRDRYPSAEFRSFADEVASFIDRKLLIVAEYRRASDTGRHRTAADPQQLLFGP